MNTQASQVALVSIIWLLGHVPPWATADEFNPRQVVHKTFPPIVSPKAISAAEASRDIRPEELLIGVTIDGESRAYPINMISRPTREIITDMLGGQRIAVTWCHLCHNGIVYRAELDGKPVTLVVSGMLWKRNLVMRDQESKSLWSHMLGRCMKGPMEGAVLKSIPCEITTWKDWQAKHPATTAVVLPRTLERYEKSFYSDLSQFVIIRSRLGRARAWTLSDLQKHLIVNDAFGESPLLITYDEESTAGRIFSRGLADLSPASRTIVANAGIAGVNQLNFDRAEPGTMKDRETGSVWEIDSATAVEGQLSGVSLKRQVATMANLKAWKAFYPDGSLWREPRNN